MKSEDYFFGDKIIWNNGGNSVRCVFHRYVGDPEEGIIKVQREDCNKEQTVSVSDIEGEW